MRDWDSRICSRRTIESLRRARNSFVRPMNSSTLGGKTPPARGASVQREPLGGLPVRVPYPESAQNHPVHDGPCEGIFGTIARPEHRIDQLVVESAQSPRP